MMTAMRTPLVMLASAFVLAGCSSLNPFSSRAPQPAPLVDFTPGGELRVVSQGRVGARGDFRFQPAVVGDAVIAAGNDGSVARFEGGREVWRSNVGTRLSAGVGASERLAVVVSTGGEVIALDSASGAERWRTDLRAEVLAPPGVGSRTVAVRASDNRLFGFDIESGERRWEYQRSMPPLSLRSDSGMIVDDNDAVVGFPGGKLLAISLDNGGPLWELTVATPRGVTELERITDVVGTAVLGRREVCAVTYQGRAACFDLGDGRATWSREFSSSVGMDRDTRFAFITDTGDAVVALDAFNGSTVWRQDAMTRRQVSRPLVVGDRVVVGDRDGYVHALEREDGRFAARTRVDNSAIVADPVLLGPQRFVIQSSQGGVYVLEAQ